MSKAFTLLEIIIFIGIFGIIGILIFPFLINTLNYYLATQETIDLSREARNIVLTLKRETIQSKNISHITNYELVLDKFNEEKSIILKTSRVELDFNTSKLRGMISNLRIGSISLADTNYGVRFTSSSNCYISPSVFLPSVYSFSGYAWSPQIGWIKFRNDSSENITYGVCLESNNELRGFAYNDVIGWIVFNCRDLNICSTSNFKVIYQNGYLKGFAWNDILGWFFFDGDRGQIYLVQVDKFFNILRINRLSNPRINVDELKFTSFGSLYGVDISLTDEKNLNRLNYSTAISLPFK